MYIPCIFRAVNTFCRMYGPPTIYLFLLTTMKVVKVIDHLLKPWMELCNYAYFVEVNSIRTRYDNI